MKPIKRDRTIDYVCKCDREEPTAKQTVFVLSQLSVNERALIKNNMEISSDNKVSLNLGTQSMLAWDLGVQEVKNFDDDIKRDEKKSFISGTRKRPWKEDCLNLFSNDTIDEVSQAVIDNMDLNEDEIKN